MNDFVCVSCVFHGLNIFFLGFLPSTRLFKRTFSMTILGFTLFLLYFVGFTMCVSILAGSLIFVETESRKDLVSFRRHSSPRFSLQCLFRLGPRCSASDRPSFLSA